MSYNLLDITKDFLGRDLQIASSEDQAKRLDICNSCEHLVKIPGVAAFTGTCKICGCFMDAKVKFAKSECPEKRWLALPSSDQNETPQ